MNLEDEFNRVDNEIEEIKQIVRMLIDLESNDRERINSIERVVIILGQSRLKSLGGKLRQEVQDCLRSLGTLSMQRESMLDQMNAKLEELTEESDAGSADHS